MNKQNKRSAATLKWQTNECRRTFSAFLYPLAIVALSLALAQITIAANPPDSSRPSSSLSADQLVFNQQLRSHVASLGSLVAKKPGDAEKLNADVVVVTFFASWCPPCRDEFKALNEISSVLADRKVAVVAINAFEEFDDNDASRMKQFLQQTAPQFQVVKGTKETLALFGGVNRIPTLFVFDQHGKQAYNFVHARGASKRSAESNELLAAIMPLLKE